MSKVLTCTDYDSAAQQCIAQAWVDQSDWTNYLPTVGQAGMVGAVYFTGLMTLAVLKGLLNPKSTED